MRERIDMAQENKTQPTGADVGAFIAGIADDGRRRDMETLVAFVGQILDEPPMLWGGSIIGFGSFSYRGKSGRTGTWMEVGIASRKAAIVFYLSFDLSKYQTILSRLGRHATGVGCLYVKRLADIDLAVLRELVEATQKETRSFAA